LNYGLAPFIGKDTIDYHINVLERDNIIIYFDKLPQNTPKDLDLIVIYDKHKFNGGDSMFYKIVLPLSQPPKSKILITSTDKDEKLKNLKDENGKLIFHYSETHLATKTYWLTMERAQWLRKLYKTNSEDAVREDPAELL